MRIFAVIVTYGNRFHFLKKVIDSAFSEGVLKIIVIDNNSNPESKKQLAIYEKKLGSNKIKVSYLDKNYGSAGGFKKGLEEAYNDTDCEFIWLLDDDNQPKKDSLNVLKDHWNSIVQEDKNETVSLLSYRKDRKVYKEAIMINNPDLVLGRKNSFLGFHLVDFPKKVLKVIKRKLGIQAFVEDKNIKSGKVSVAPYGGIFIHKNIISKIGFPNKDFFVYSDDYDWSYRMTNIYLLLNSEIEDIDTSWHLKEKPASPFYSFLNYGSDFRVYYGVRNRVYFDKKLLTNKLLYKMNEFLYMLVMYLFRNKKNKKRYLLFKRAVHEGGLGELGNSFNINEVKLL